MHLSFVRLGSVIMGLGMAAPCTGSSTGSGSIVRDSGTIGPSSSEDAAASSTDPTPPPATGSATLTGDVSSMAFTVESALATLETTPPDNSDCPIDGGCGTDTFSAQSVTITLNNRSSLDCSALIADSNAGVSFANVDSMTMNVDIFDGPVTPGTYTFGVRADGPTVTASFATTDASCNTAFASIATGGSVTIKTITTASVSGTYNLIFPQGSFSGAFNSPICDLGDAATPSSNGTPTCK